MTAPRPLRLALLKDPAALCDACVVPSGGSALLRPVGSQAPPLCVWEGAAAAAAFPGGRSRGRPAALALAGDCSECCWGEAEASGVSECEVELVVTGRDGGEVLRMVSWILVDWRAARGRG